MVHQVTGALRQEFRELEMLDDITTLRYNGKLLSSVVGDRRNDLISAFRLLKGEKYVPSNVHRAIRWKQSDPFHLSEGTDVAWRIVDASDKLIPAPSSKKQPISHIIQPDGTLSTPLLGKRKLGADFEAEASETALKKIKSSSNATTEHCIPNNPSKGGPDFKAEASKTASKKKIEFKCYNGTLHTK